MKRRVGGHFAGTAFEKALAACTPRDFDGHSEFGRLTPEQRLDWLDDLVDFVVEHSRRSVRGDRIANRNRLQRGRHVDRVSFITHGPPR